LDYTGEAEKGLKGGEGEVELAYLPAAKGIRESVKAVFPGLKAVCNDKGERGGSEGQQ